MSHNRRAQEIEDVQAVMATPAGRRFLHRLLDRGRVFRPCFSGNSATFWNEGRRELALEFFSDIVTHAGADYLLMMQEALAMASQEQQQQQKEDRDGR